MDLTQLVEQIGLPVIAVLVPLAVAWIKSMLPNLPPVTLPVIAAVIGPLADFGLAKLAGIAPNGVAAALVGLAGVGVREVVDQTKKMIQS